MENSRWNLRDILDEQQFNVLGKSLHEWIVRFGKSKEKLHPMMDAIVFQRIMHEHELLLEELGKISAFSELKDAEDLSSEQAKVYKAKAEDLSVAFQEATMPLMLWIKGLPVQGLALLEEKNAERLFASVPALTYVLKLSRKEAKHTLSENEERILARKKVTTRALFELYQLLSDSFVYEFEVHGAKKIIETKEELLKYAQSKDPDERYACYQALLKPYTQELPKLFLIYSALIKDWMDDVQLRHYFRSISMRNLANNIDDDVVATLLSVCQEKKGLFQEFFQLKAKLLSIDKLRRYDVYAKLGNDEDDIPHEEAERIVLQSFSQFSPSFAEKAKQIMDAQHLDSHPRKNKVSGAFCAAVTPQILPYVLTNYNGTKNSVFTLAHELGHGIHDMYASINSISAMSPGLPLAETASTFGEMLVFEALYAQCKNNDERIAMLVDKLTDTYATIMRQAYFVLFEMHAHEKIKEGITASALCAKYLENLQEQFGSSVIVDDLFKVEWTYIPHVFATPFYCYAYNFGELLSLSLYAVYKKKGVSFVPQIEAILAAGGSRDPQKLLFEAGFDIASKEFWEQSFSLLEKLLDELKELAGKQ